MAAASRLASRAATSIGACIGRMLSSSSGNRTRISRSTAGQAELITGRRTWLPAIYRRVASETSSAARATSNTSSNPISSSAPITGSTSSRLLNCP